MGMTRHIFRVETITALLVSCAYIAFIGTTHDANQFVATTGMSFALVGTYVAHEAKKGILHDYARGGGLAGIYLVLIASASEVLLWLVQKTAF